MKITFVGAGSTVFVNNIIGDCMLTEPLRDATVALYDINPSACRSRRRCWTR